MPKSLLLKLVRLSLLGFMFFLFFPVKDLVFTTIVFNSGFFNPYTSQYFYLADLCFIFFVFLFFYAWASGALNVNWRFGRKEWLLLSLVALSFLSSFLAPEFFVSFFVSLRLLQFVLVYLLLSTGVIDFKLFARSFLLLLLIVCLIALYQFFAQKSLGLAVLGEPFLSIDVKGIAKYPFTTDLFKPYGLFAHPNLFGAYLLFGLYFLFLPDIVVNRWGSAAIACLFILLLFIVFSRMALVALFLLFCVNYASRYLAARYLVFASLLIIFIVQSSFFFFDGASVVERLELIDISRKAIMAHPFGVGAGSFTILMQAYSSVSLQPWLFQPVHNVFLLIASEIGFLSLLIFLYLVVTVLFCKIKEKAFPYLGLSMGVLLILFFDHYLWTLYQGMFLFALWLYLSNRPEVVRSAHNH